MHWLFVLNSSPKMTQVVCKKKSDAVLHCFMHQFYTCAISNSWNMFKHRRILVKKCWDFFFFPNPTVDGSEIPRPTTVWMVLKACKWFLINHLHQQLVSLPDFRTINRIIQVEALPGWRKGRICWAQPIQSGPKDGWEKERIQKEKYGTFPTKKIGKCRTSTEYPWNFSKL